MKNHSALSVVAVAGLSATGAWAASVTPHGGMIRFADVSANEIVFVYANDLWVVPREGGEARPLASPPGSELFPKFSPDGETIAFVGNYEGDRDVYVVPREGGEAFRVTHHPSNELVTGWSPDGRIIFNMNQVNGQARQHAIYLVSPDGGMPEKLPVAYGAMGAINDTGEWLAFTPASRDFRTWKRYRGGLASDIWLFNLNTLESEKITNWEGTDTIPMWHGETVYYLSDGGPEEKLNIWSYHVPTGERTQLTTFSEYDTKFPSMGPGADGEGEIVLQNGSSIYLLNLGTGEATAVDISIPGDRPKLRKHTVDVGEFVMGGSLGATGKRAVLAARGDIWTVPEETGIPRAITATNGAAERDPIWSPDGQWIAYISDADGEYELYVTQSDGKGETRQLTDGNTRFLRNPVWSPDSESVAYHDKAGKLYITKLEDGSTIQFGEDPGARRDIRLSWSPDSRWITYHRNDDRSITAAVWIYDTENDESHQVTSAFFNDHDPTFGSKGDWLYYASNRRFENPSYEDIGATFVYDGTDVLIAVPLRDDVENPMAKEIDEETWEDAAADADEDDADADADDGDGADEGEDADADQPADEEKELSPIHGVWNGTASGFSALGAPEDTQDFKLTVVVDEDGNVSATSKSSGETHSYDSAAFDESSGKFTAERSEQGLTIKLEGTLEGDTISGSWEIPEMGVSGEWSATKTDEEPEVDEESEGEVGPVEIELAGFEARGFELPVDPGNFRGLACNNKGALMYLSGGGFGIPSLKIFNINDDDPTEKNVVTGVGGFALSGDGKKAIVAAPGPSIAIINASSGQSLGDTLDLSKMKMRIDPRVEWAQIFNDAWRTQRDFFYVENMHGVDWDLMRERYGAMLEDCTSREDVGYVIGEMIAELNVGHAYYFGGDYENEPNETVGMLGVDWEVGTETDENGDTIAAYRVAKKLHGAPWDSDARGPLDALGVGVDEGAYLIAVNGVPVDTDQDPWAPFVGLAGETVGITFADALTGDDETRNERDVAIELIDLNRERQLRYRDWVETNRKYVSEASSGRVGYIHVPDTGINGQNELFRQFYGQTNKEALMIDERWNGGGQLPTRFIELLNRPRSCYFARRDGSDFGVPFDSHQGPKAMLINGEAGSGGDMFPWLFRHEDLGPLIGTRTWGGLVGYDGSWPPLIDGAFMSVPTIGFYETDGTWGVEGHGVDPDIEVIDNPSNLARGIDAQIDTAIEYLVEEADRHGYKRAPRPADPDRSGIGIRPEDK